MKGCQSASADDERGRTVSSLTVCVGVVGCTPLREGVVCSLTDQRREIRLESGEGKVGWRKGGQGREGDGQGGAVC